jgi:hypothetical protein
VDDDLHPEPPPSWWVLLAVLAVVLAMAFALGVALGRFL